jgi:hypothetical protein
LPNAASTGEAAWVVVGASEKKASVVATMRDFVMAE